MNHRLGGPWKRSIDPEHVRAMAAKGTEVRRKASSGPSDGTGDCGTDDGTVGAFVRLEAAIKFVMASSAAPADTAEVLQR